MATTTPLARPDTPTNHHSPGTVAWVGACKTRLGQPFSADLIEEKNGLAYLPHEIIRQRLIEATGNCFDWTIDQILFRDDGVTRRAKDRTTGETPRPLSMVVVGRLAIPELGTRAGIGAHPLDAGSGEDAAYKSAESDALKRAAMAFGVGLEQLYLETGEAKRSQMKRRSARSAIRQSPPQGGSQLEWQQRIDAALALPPTDGKRVWHHLVAEATEANSREQFALLVRSARSTDAARAIIRHAEAHGIAGLERALQAHTRPAEH